MSSRPQTSIMHTLTSGPSLRLSKPTTLLSPGPFLFQSTRPRLHLPAQTKTYRSPTYSSLMTHVTGAWTRSSSSICSSRMPATLAPYLRSTDDRTYQTKATSRMDSLFFTLRIRTCSGQQSGISRVWGQEGSKRPSKDFGRRLREVRS